MPRSTRPLLAIAVTVLCAGLYAPPAMVTPFFTKGEPREALVVRHMVEMGDWILPRRPDPEGTAAIASKPPMFHWLAAAASAVHGHTTEWTVRLPSLALGTAAVVAVALVGQSVLGSTAAFTGAVVLATSFEWVRAASTARVDATLVAFMTAGLLLFYRGTVHGGLSRPEAALAYVALCCAALTKGPVGVLLPGLVLGVALLVTGRWRAVPRFHPLLGLGLVLAVIGGWYVAASLLGGDAFVQKQVLKENVFRFLGASRMKSGHEHAFYYYVPSLLSGFLPWTPFLVAAMVAAARSAPARRDPRVAFLLVWVAVVFVFYSAASAKRSVYLLALYPAAALLTGWWWAELARGALRPRWLGGRTTRTIAFVACAVALVPVALALAEGWGFAPLDRIAPLLHHRDRANIPIVRDILDAHIALITATLALAFAALVAAVHALRRERWMLLFASFAVIASAAWVLVFSLFQPDLARQRSLQPFMAAAARASSDAPLSFYPGTFDFGAFFYAPSGTRTWNEHDDGPGPRHVLIWDADLAALPPDERARLDVISTSDGTDPNGRKHLVLARLR